MATNKLDKLYMSQCISSDYCKGWNAAVEEANKTIERLENLLNDKCDTCISIERVQAFKRVSSEFNDLIDSLVKEYKV